MAYTKLHQSLVSSTIWREPHTTRIVWVTMMAMADKNGEVMASIPGLADLARVSIGECETALAAFLSPDKYSRTKTLDGRRIQEIRGGWSLINHPEYRAMASREDETDRARERMARMRMNRSEQKRTDPNKREPLRSVTENMHIADADADADADSLSKRQRQGVTPLTPLVLSNQEDTDSSIKIRFQPERKEIPVFDPSVVTWPKAAAALPSPVEATAEAQAPPTKSKRAKTAIAPSQPKDFEEFKLQATKAGLPDDETEKCFRHYEMTMWTYSSGGRREPLKDWTRAVGKWAANWRSDGGKFGNGKPGKPKGNNDYVPCRSEYEEGGVVFEQMRANSARHQAEIDAECAAELAALISLRKTKNK